MLLATYYELNDFAAGKKLLQVMLKRWPDKADYWRQLAGMHQFTGDYQQALAILELAYTRSIPLSADDLYNLAVLYVQQQQPHGAARVLTRALDEKVLPSKARYYKLLGDAHYLARDREAASRALTRAADLSQDGRIWLRLAQLALADERWSDAVDAARKAFGAQNRDEDGSAYMILGIAYAESGDTIAAKGALTEAARFDKTRKPAEGWLAYLSRAHEAQVTDKGG